MENTIMDTVAQSTGSFVTSSTIRTKLVERVAAERARVEAQVRTLEANLDQWKRLEFLATLELEGVCERAKRLGLELHYTGSNSNSIELRGDAIEGGKFKFVAFNGYTSRGDGRNDERLREKAHKLEDRLSDDARGVRAHVNPYSLERRGDKNPRVLISIQFSNPLETK